MIHAVRPPASSHSQQSAVGPPGLRTALVVGAAVVAFLLLAGARSLDWGGDPAMLLGELIGLILPLAVIAAAAWGFHAVWRRWAAPDL